MALFVALLLIVIVCGGHTLARYAGAMTWRALNYGTAENDEGTRVSRVGYKLLVYARGGRKIEIDVEAGADDLGIYANSIHCWQPDDAAVSDSERAAILQDIEEALRALKVPFAVLWN